jgi:hypothetical protein
MKIEIVQLAGRDGDTVYNLNRTLRAIATCAADTDIGDREGRELLLCESPPAILLLEVMLGKDEALLPERFEGPHGVCCAVACTLWVADSIRASCLCISLTDYFGIQIITNAASACYS